MNKDKNGPNLKAGFTLVEILVVLAIIAIILGVILASLKAAKDKSADAETRKVISEIALKAEGKEIAPGVVDYQSAFNSISAQQTVAQLAAKYSSGQYQYIVSPKSYAIVFPLKNGKYYCIDSKSHATAVEIPNLFQLGGPQSCSDVLFALGGGGGTGGALTGGDTGGGGGIECRGGRIIVGVDGQKKCDGGVEVYNPDGGVGETPGGIGGGPIESE